MFCKKDSNKVVLIPVTLEPFIKTIIRDKIEFLLHVLISAPLIIAVTILIVLSLIIAGYCICIWEWRMQSGIKCG